MIPKTNLEWREVRSYVLGNTEIELVPEYGSGWYFVVDVNNGREKVLTDALPLKQAKKSAEYIQTKRQMKKGK